MAKRKTKRPAKRRVKAEAWAVVAGGPFIRSVHTMLINAEDNCLQYRLAGYQDAGIVKLTGEYEVQNEQ